MGPALVLTLILIRYSNINPRHNSLAMAHNLAGLMSEQERDEEALVLYERVLLGYEQTRAASSDNIQNDINNNIANQQQLLPLPLSDPPSLPHLAAMVNVAITWKKLGSDKDKGSDNGSDKDKSSDKDKGSDNNKGSGSDNDKDKGSPLVQAREMFERSLRGYEQTPAIGTTITITTVTTTTCTIPYTV